MRSLTIVVVMVACQMLYAAAPTAGTAPPVAKPDVYASDPGRSPLVLAAKKVSSSVVSIGSTETRYYRRQLMLDDWFAPFVLYPEKEKLPYRGSGFIVHKDGYIVTNYHVIEDATDLFVTLPDRRELKAKVIDADMVVDIALLKVEGENLTPIEFGDSDKLHIGEWSLAIGNPFGNWIEDPHPTVTVGVVSALNRSFSPDYDTHDTRRVRVYQGMIQTDAAINPGNSGGPLINIRGEVIGINTFIFSRVGGSHGIGFAIPINRVKQIVDEIMKYGRIRDLRLDFKVMNISGSLARRLRLTSTAGALVYERTNGGPAEKAGLGVGDVIVKIGDQSIRSRDDLIALFAARHVGDVLTFRVRRDGRELDVEYTIVENKPAEK